MEGFILQDILEATVGILTYLSLTFSCGNSYEVVLNTISLANENKNIENHTSSSYHEFFGRLRDEAIGVL